MTNTLGSQWYKFDFHTHTPASGDFRDIPAPSAQEWLKSAMNAELDCVAVTDHNTSGWIENLQTEYEKSKSESWFRPLIIFPGCEITISLGIDRIHFLAIFDPSTTKDDITHFLGSCDVVGSPGDPDNCFTQRSIASVIEKIEAKGGLAMPAHIDGAKGLLYGKTNTNTDLKSILKQFNVAQFNNIEYLEHESINLELKNDCSHLAKVKGSDAHRIQDLGTSYSWVKLYEISISALKYALQDSSYCILNQTDNPNQYPSSYINRLVIKDMIHCGKFEHNRPIFQLHPLFNTIIGGRGTGKSTFIEALRLALGKHQEISTLKNINEDLTNFINGVTINSTEIQLEAKSYASEYLSVWQKNSGLTLSKKVTGDWVADPGKINDRLPVNLYSQKQINALASSPNSLLEIIDRSATVQKSIFDSQLAELEQKLLDLMNEEHRLLKSIQTESQLNSELLALNSNIHSYQVGGHGTLLENIDLMSRVDRSIRSIDLNDFLVSLEFLSNYSFPQLNPLTHPQLDLTLKDELEQINTQFVNTLFEIKQQISTLTDSFKSALQDHTNKINSSSWYAQKVQTDEEYQAMLTTYEQQGVSFNSNEYEGWIARREFINDQLSIICTNKERLAEISSLKDSLNQDIINTRFHLCTKRQEFIDSILQGNKYVQIKVKPYSYNSDIETIVRQILGTENFRNSIYNPDSPEGTILNNIINCEETSEAKIQAKSEICSIIKNLIEGISPEGYNIDQRLITHLQSRFSQQPEFYARLAVWMPNDKLEIKYSKNGNGQNFANISKGSAGQKAAAILAFLLSHGDEPIIIDQPEDDLDNALISDLIVHQIQHNKNKRQIIIVTHNPNIVVNGDADLVNVMHYQGGQVQIKNTGSLVNEEIRHEVCEIMEGGKDAFLKRYRRIGAPLI